MPRARRFVAAAACLLCVACPAPPPQPAPPDVAPASPTPSPLPAASDPTLRWAINEPTAIIPIDATTADDLLVVDALFDSLTAWDESLAVQPAVAMRWERGAGARVWRFFLKPTAQFTDGSQVTAQHFVRTWNDMARNGRAHHHLQDVEGYQAVRRGTAPALEGVRAIDATTLEVRLSRPMAEFPAVVAHPALGPMAAPAENAAEREMPVGNGRFRMAEPWVHGEFVRLTRDGTAPPTGRGGATPLAEVVFQIADPASAYIAYEQGGVDVATVPPVALTAEVAPAEPTTRYRGPGLLRGRLPSTYFLLCNTGRPPCDSVDARRGIALAVDRPRMAANVFFRSAAPSAEVIPPVVPPHRRRTCTQCAHDPTRARTLLQRAGVEKTRMWISKGGDHHLVAKRVAADLERVGVRVSIKIVPFATFLRALRRGAPGLFRFGWTLDYPTGDNAVRPLFHSSGRVNYARYARRDVDALLDTAAGAAGAGRRAAAYQAVQDLILDRDQAVIPVVGLRRRTVVADRVRNLVYGPFGTANFEAVRVVERTG